MDFIINLILYVFFFILWMIGLCVMVSSLQDTYHNFKSDRPARHMILSFVIACLGFALLSFSADKMNDIFPIFDYLFG